jgi:hypothetical protein
MQVAEERLGAIMKLIFLFRTSLGKKRTTFEIGIKNIDILTSA